jgi:hypothetical protein
MHQVRKSGERGKLAMVGEERSYPAPGSKTPKQYSFATELIPLRDESVVLSSGRPKESFLGEGSAHISVPETNLV